jgi:hypothetical protein
MVNRFFTLIVALCSAVSVTAQEQSFFTDPSLLQPWDQGTYDLGYVAPDIMVKAQRYDSVMVDQPEIFVADDSKYRGAKPDHLKQLVDTARRAMIERLEGSWDVVDEPGPNVIYMRWAIDELYLKKKKRGILSYTPIGLVVHTTAQAAIRDLWKKIDIVELGLKLEWVDSVSGEVLSAGKAKRGTRKSKGHKAELVSWEELDALFRTIGEQTRCHMDNNRVAVEEKRLDCDSIMVEQADS